MSTPRYRSEPPSRSGSAISVSTATTPSRPGLKSLIALECICKVPSSDGPPRDPHPRRRHRAGAHRGDAARPRGDWRRVRVGRASRGHGRHGGARRKPAPRRGAGGDPRHGRRAQGADHDPGRRRLPVGERRAPEGSRPLRAGAPLQELPGRAHALRGRRPRRRAREHRGPLRGDRVRAGLARGRGADRLDRGARRPARAPRRGDLDQADLDLRHAPHRPVRLRLRAPERPPQGHGRAQGEHHEVLRRPLPARRARGRGRERRRRVRRPDRGQHVDAARPAARGVRRARVPEPLRRRGLGSLRGDDWRARHGAGGERRRGDRGLRADARLGAQVRRPEQGQPDGADALGDADAPLPGGARGGRPARGGDRRGDPRGRERHVRHEALARRSLCGRHERGRGRDRREARGAGVTRARAKVTVVGAGNVGATCAQVLALRDYADVVLVDIKEGLPQGKALDIAQMGAVLGFEPSLQGSNGYEETAGSDVVVITAGLPRSPGMSRDDLVTTNEKIVGEGTERVVERSPDAVLVVVSNPLDAMCHVAKNVSGWPKERVFGMAGILDTARFATFIAWETGSSVKDVTAVVLGGHGDQMVPVVSATTVGGVPLRKLVPEERIQALVERTAKGGGEVVNLLGTSAWYAPGAAAAQMVDAILLDEKRVLPCTAYLEGEYGIDGLYMGVPVKLGARGVEQVIELELGDEERKALDDPAGAVREVVSVLST